MKISYIHIAIFIFEIENQVDLFLWRWQVFLVKLINVYKYYLIFLWNIDEFEQIGSFNNH